MFIKEFENGIGYAVIVKGGSDGVSKDNFEQDDLANAALVIWLYHDHFNITKNRYGKLHSNLPICLLDDYLEHFSRKFEYRSPILDNFNLAPDVNTVPGNYVYIKNTPLKNTSIYKNIIRDEDLIEEIKKYKQKKSGDEFTKEEFYKMWNL